MISPPGIMSPVSTDGSEWSGINHYGKTDSTSSHLSRGAIPTPPTSSPHSYNPLELNPSSPNGLSPLPPGGMSSQNPSPPSSVTSKSVSRVSDGTQAEHAARRQKRMEDILSHHYMVFRRYLHSPQDHDPSAGQSVRARDKLFRLSSVQFVELSTDVYDELLRRQAATAPPRPGMPKPEVPPHLLPQQEYHQKRNQARGKLASLHPQKFRSLTTDVFVELERRIPPYSGGDMSRRGSPAPSMHGRYGSGVNGYGPGPPRPDSNGSYGYGPNGYPPPRAQSRGPPPGHGGPPPRFPPGGPPGGRFPPRHGSLGGGAGGPPPPVGLGVNGETIPENTPYQKSFQSNTIVPNKSTLVEDEEDGAGYDDDEDIRSDAFTLDKDLQSRRDTTATMGNVERDKKLSDAEAQISSLQKKIEELESELKTKDEEVNSLRGGEGSRQSSWDAERKEWEQAQADVSHRLSDIEKQNSSLVEQLEDARRHQHDAEQELEHLREQQVAVGVGGSGGGGNSGDGDWQARFEDLDREHQSLKADFKQQQEVTEQVRQQATAFLEEMKALSQSGGSSLEREESLSRDVHRLEEEVKHWKNRYAKTKTQLRHLRSSSLGLPGHTHDVVVYAKENDLTQPDGLIKDVHVTKFQMAIEELIRNARSDEPSMVLDQMKAVIVSVRYITRDIEIAQTHGQGDETSHPRNRAKTRVSATANNLITASRNFANSNGLSPVSLLDAAASHLTAAVVELVRTVKIQPTPENELADQDGEEYLPSIQSAGYFSITPSQTRFSANESIYSAISSPHSRTRSQTLSRLPQRNTFTSSKHGYGAQSSDRHLEELRIYLEDQTESLVQSIQSLVSSIRGTDDIVSVQTHIDTISTVVGKVVSSTEAAIASPKSSPALRERTGPIIQILTDCRQGLLNAGREGDRIDQTNPDPEQIREITNKLPPIAFQIARETKELVQRVDQLELEGEGEEDDFR